MALPKLNQLTTDHVIELDDDLTVTFQLSPIAGTAYNAIIDAHRDDDGKAPHEAVAVDVLTAGIRAVYSSQESTPADFTETDARELWDEWPDWARWSVYGAVVRYSTQGPGADPFDGPKRRRNADS